MSSGGSRVEAPQPCPHVLRHPVLVRRPHRSALPAFRVPMCPSLRARPKFSALPRRGCPAQAATIPAETPMRAIEVAAHLDEAHVVSSYACTCPAVSAVEGPARLLFAIADTFVAVPADAQECRAHAATISPHSAIAVRSLRIHAHKSSPLVLALPLRSSPILLVRRWKAAAQAGSSFQGRSPLRAVLRSASGSSSQCTPLRVGSSTGGRTARPHVPSCSTLRPRGRVRLCNCGRLLRVILRTAPCPQCGHRAGSANPLRGLALQGERNEKNLPCRHPLSRRRTAA